MKSSPRFEKTASSALIFATISCVAANFSPAHAAPDISTTAAVRVESSKEAFPASTDLSMLTETVEQAEGVPAANQPTEAALANPTNEAEITTPTEDTWVEPTQTAASEVAVVASPAEGAGVEEKQAEKRAEEAEVEEKQGEKRAGEAEVEEKQGEKRAGEAEVEEKQGESFSPTSRQEISSLASPASPTPPALLQTATDSTEISNEIRVQDLTTQPQLQAQSLPADEVNETVSPEEMPLDSLEAVEEDDPLGQVTNVTQLSDVRPTDWAFEALRSLVERYGCIAGYPDRTYRGNRSMTRYEFAAGLNACLQQIERLIQEAGSNLASRQDLETLRRLVNEFQPELATIRTRVDQVEGRVATLEGNQFSTTTKLFGQVIFGVQGRSENSFDFFPPNRFEDRGTNINLVDSVQLSLFTQFGPRSLLLTGLAAGNGAIFGSPSLPNYVALGYQSGFNNDVEISDLNFRQLIGSKFAVIFGPVGVNPVNVFRGVNRVESAGQGPLSRFAQRNPIINIGGNGGGIGFDWQIATRLSLQAVYSANRIEDPSEGGIFGGNNGATTIGAQLVASPTNNIDISLQYINAYSPTGELVPGNNNGVGDNLLVLQNFDTGRAPIQTNALGLSLEWRVTPGITIGGWGGYTNSDFRGGSGEVETVNWMAFLNFPDLFGQGNLAGIYVGQPPKITSSDVSDAGLGRNIPNFVNRGDFLAGEGGQPDSTLHLEAFYRIRVTDNISVTPGAIVLFNPNQNDNNDTITIGALRTTFTF